MSKSLSHTDNRGKANMVDVSDKSVTARTATAEGYILLTEQTRDLVITGQTAKGDTLAVARVAGIMAAKKTSELIPLCHPLALSKVSVDFEATSIGIRITATAKLTGQTGVEMEALTAVSVAALTLYDMIKAVEAEAVITNIRLCEKIGGKSGHYVAQKQG